jgi:hypothetical protein
LRIFEAGTAGEIYKSFSVRKESLRSEFHPMILAQIGKNDKFGAEE